MREDPRWARIALLLNLVGTILLALSFQATSSDFRFVTTHDHTYRGRTPRNDMHFDTVYALCTNDTTMIAEGIDSNGVPNIVLNVPRCPDNEHAKSAAVVNTEHPKFLFVGLGFNTLGFALQFLIVPRRRTIAEINDEMRVLRKQKKFLELEAERKP